MNIYKWLIIAEMVVSAFVLVYRIGKPRPSVTPLDAVFGLVEFGAVIWLVVLA
jgi:hypothetical protein